MERHSRFSGREPETADMMMISDGIIIFAQIWQKDLQRRTLSAVI